MKILTPSQLRKADQHTTEKEGISSWQLMERASLAATKEIKSIVSLDQTITVLSGSGNNGGDGLAIAYHLNNLGFEVEVKILKYTPEYSNDTLQNLKRLKAEPRFSIQYFDKESKTLEVEFNEVVIDAIFGIGLNRALPVFVADIIKKVNRTSALRIAIDVPSGLYLSELTPENSVVFRADYTLTFQCPKLNFFLPDYGNYLGEIRIINIGLHQSFISKLDSTYEFVNQDTVEKLFKPRQRFSHKGDYGHLLVIGGQYGMMGSVSLTTKAALKSGAGKVSVLSPKCGVEILQQFVPEAMVFPADNQEQVSPVNLSFKPANICIGMGLGQSSQALETLKFAIKTATTPMLIDADGLNLLAKNKNLLDQLPSQSILTPHQGELKRLIGEWTDQYDKLEKMISFVREYDIILVSKDAYTFIVDKDKTYINSTGNSGMATAGSGDTLSGIISGLLVQKYLPIEASVLGVFLHGKAADIYAETRQSNTLIASDIIDYLSLSFS